MLVNPSNAQWRTAFSATPATAPPRTSHAELILGPSSRANATSARITVGTSTIAERASSQVTPAIKPTAATLTPSSMALVRGEARSRATQVYTSATKQMEGKKKTNKTTNTPKKPPRRKPKNKAVVN